VKIEKGQLRSIITDRANICSTVLIFPDLSATMIMPSLAATDLKLVITNSRARITMASYPAILPSCTKQIKADVIRSLSARGSIILPKSVMRLYFLAKYPSRASVIEAATKRIPDM